MGWRRKSVLFVVAGCSFGAHPAAAARLGYDIAGVMQWEDNLFRLPRGAADQLPHGGADRVSALHGSFTIDGESGNISFGGSLTGQQSWFAHNDYLDNFGYAAKARGRYAGLHTSFAMDGTFLRRLTSFEDIRGTDRNFQTLATASAEATQEIGGDIRAIARGTFVRSTNSLDVIALNDYRRIGGAAGLGFYSPAGNIIAIEGSIETSHGLADRVADNSSGSFLYRSNYVETSIAARLYWQPSVIWQIDARLGYTWHDDRSAVAIDFSGLTGDATVTWSPRAAIHIGLRGVRRYESDSAIFSNGIRDSEFSGSLTADATDRLSITFNARRTWRLFRYDSQAISPLLARGTDQTSLSAALAYRAGPVLITVTGRREIRHSSQAAYRFKANVLDVAVSVPLGAADPRTIPTTAF